MVFETENMRYLQPFKYEKVSVLKSLLKFKLVLQTNDDTYWCLYFTRTAAFRKLSNGIDESLIYFLVRVIIASRKSKVVIKYEAILGF